MTESTDFPTVNAYDATYNGGQDTFAVKIDLYSEYQSTTTTTTTTSTQTTSSSITSVKSIAWKGIDIVSFIGVGILLSIEVYRLQKRR